jgi:hypothetical protein
MLVSYFQRSNVLCLLYVLDSILCAVSYPVIRCMEKSRIDTEARYNTTFAK